MTTAKTVPTWAAALRELGFDGDPETLAAHSRAKYSLHPSCAAALAELRAATGEPWRILAVTSGGAAIVALDTGAEQVEMLIPVRPSRTTH